MAGADITPDPRLAARAPGLLEMTGVDEEGGLPDARAAQGGEQAGGALFDGHEPAGPARHVVEAEGDPLLRLRRGGDGEQGQQTEE